MADYALSSAADADINHIARLQMDECGLAGAKTNVSAKTYVTALHGAFQRLADFPGLGRNATHIRPGYLRAESAGHVIFCRERPGGILIIRILHERMDFLIHLP